MRSTRSASVSRQPRSKRSNTERMLMARDETKTKIELEPHQIILRPLVTEKGVHRSTRYNRYAFEVNRLANKNDVQRAIEALFNVRVVRVNTQNRAGKPRRTRTTLTSHLQPISTP